MKIFISCIPFDHGKSGISIYVRNVVKEFAAKGHELTLLVEPNAVDSFPGHKIIVAPRIVRIPLFSMLYHLFIMPFRLLGKNFDFGVITAANRRALSFYPFFTIAVVHDLAQYHIECKYDALRMFYLKYILPFFIRRAPAVVAISQTTADDLIKYWRVPAYKIRVVYNGLSLDATPGDGTWRQRIGLGDDPYILYISRLESPGKNHINLIRAYDQLPEEIAGRYKLVFVGADWHGADAIHDAASQAKYHDRIVFPGFIEKGDLREAYEHASCYAFPSFYEGFGLSLIEAMHYRVPCCCSNNSSLAEVAGEAGLLFDPAKPEEIAAAMKEILTSEDTRKRLIAAGVKRCGDFTWKHHVEEMFNIYHNSGADRAVLLSFPIDRLSLAESMDRIMDMARNPIGRCRLLATINVDFVVNATTVFFHHGNDELQSTLRRSDFICADGMPLVLLASFLGIPLPGRVTGADMVPLLMEKAAKEGLSVYILGGSAESTQKALDILKSRFPELQVAGVDTPFVSLDDTPENRQQDKEICARIKAAKPNLLMVAFGNPKQELWLRKNIEQLEVPAAIGIGGSFNFISGTVKRAPQWMQYSGLEWIYRIIQEPKRLWKRYALGFLKFNYLSFWAILASWLAFFRSNSDCFIVNVNEEDQILEVDCTGVNKLDNQQRYAALGIFCNAAEKKYTCRWNNAGIFLRFQLWAHRLK